MSKWKSAWLVGPSSFLSVGKNRRCNFPSPISQNWPQDHTYVRSKNPQLPKSLFSLEKKNWKKKCNGCCAANRTNWIWKLKFYWGTTVGTNWLQVFRLKNHKFIHLPLTSFLLKIICIKAKTKYKILKVTASNYDKL